MFKVWANLAITLMRTLGKKCDKNIGEKPTVCCFFLTKPPLASLMAETPATAEIQGKD